MDYILRHTWGFEKTANKISYSQFVRGISGIDKGSGIKSYSTLKRALRGLEKKGFIGAESGGGRGKVGEYQLMFLGESESRNATEIVEFPVNSTESVEFIPHSTKRVLKSKGRVTVPKTHVINVTHVNTGTKESNTKSNTICNEKNEKISGKEFNELVALFEPVNPSFERLFPNKAQRAALERMLKKHGYKKVKWILDKLPELAKSQYAPVVTTPIQLEIKLGQVIIFLGRKANEGGRVIDARGVK